MKRVYLVTVLFVIVRISIINFTWFEKWQEYISNQSSGWNSMNLTGSFSE